MASPIAQQQNPPQWTFITETSTALEKLHLLTHFDKSLRKEGYVIEQPKQNALWSKMRCFKCGERLKWWCPPTALATTAVYANSAGVLDSTDLSVSHGSKERALLGTQTAQAPRPRPYKCFFHDGKLFKGTWDCCGDRQNSKGCSFHADHTACAIQNLERAWRFHYTPSPVEPEASAGRPPTRGRGAHRHGFNKNSLSLRLVSQPRSVVSLDCEMGTAADGNTELIRLTMIDFFTQAILIDKLIYPSVPMLHYNTRYSGVTFSAMNQAVRRRACIFGRDAARNEVFRFVNSSTVVIVHGGSSDFSSLRWIHPSDKIIDTCMLEGFHEDVRQQKLRRSLKDTVFRRCGIDVQDARLPNGKKAGHDSLEDALATREIVCWWLRYIPDI